MNSRSLICITSCNRLSEVKKFIFSYVDFCNRNQSFDFLLALDGNDHGYLEFCKDFEIPMLYSDEREGVGISKNRVLQQFSGYDFYFFVDDDVELLNGIIFTEFIRIFESTNYHHMACNTPRKIIKTFEIENFTIHFANFGGAYFNFFSGEGLRQVGGWHQDFAKYKRYGHTEHTYRFFNAGLNEAPFISVEELRNYIILFNPPHVTEDKMKYTDNQLIGEEQKLIEKGLLSIPFVTLSDFHFIKFSMGFNSTVHEFLKSNTKHYPLTYGRQRRIALAEYYFEMYLRQNFSPRKFKFFLLSIINNPLNVPLKHYVKHKLKIA